jgi:ABC-type nitrate/sulfonate/bicarbonate transport system permease component
MPAVSFALIGIIVGEFIGAGRRFGILMIEAEARASAPHSNIDLVHLGASNRPRTC